MKGELFLAKVCQMLPNVNVNIVKRDLFISNARAGAPSNKLITLCDLPNLAEIYKSSAY